MINEWYNNLKIKIEYTDFFMMPYGNDDQSREVFQK